jgi:hypothetical protein
MIKNIFLLLYFSFGLTVYLSSQPKDLKFDMKYQITSNDFLVVNDTLNHKIGKAEGSGSAAFSDESDASVKVYFIYDYTNGNGDFIEYYNLTFKDGSTLTVKAKGRSLGSTDESMPLFQADVSVTGGTGIYEGAKGTGSMSGNRKNILESGSTVKLSFLIRLK